MASIKKKRYILNAVTLMFWFAQYVYGPYHTPYLLSLGIAASSAGVILGAYGFSQMILRVPVGVAADKRNRHKWFIAVGLICAGAASLLRIISPTEPAFLIANLVSGVASAMWISFTVLYSTYYKPEELQRAMGILVAFNNGGILLGFVLGAIVAETIGIVPLFYMSFIVGIIGFVVSLFIKEEKKPQSTLKISELLSVIKSRNLIVFSVLTAILQAVHMSTAMSFTSVVAQNLGATETEIGACSIIYMSLAIAGSYFIGTKYAQRLKDRTLMALFFSCYIVYCLFAPIVGSIWLLYLLQVIGGAANASLFSLCMTNAIRDIPKEKKSTAMGIFQAIYGLGMTLGPMLMGLISDNAGLTAGYWTMGVFSVSAVVMVFIVYRKKKSANALTSTTE